MNESVPHFGRALLSDPSRLLFLDAERRRDAEFNGVDILVATVLGSMLSGRKAVTHQRASRWVDQVAVEGFDTKQRATLEEVFSLERQHSHGAWYFPYKVTVPVGRINFPAHFRVQARFAWTAAIAEYATVVLKTSPDGLFCWAVLEPLCDQLFQVFALREHRAGMVGSDDARRAWSSAEENLKALGFNVAEELNPMRSGNSWSRLEIPDQLNAKERFLGALARQATPDTARRFRAACVLSLVRNYYKYAEKAPSKSRRVLTRPYQRTLSAFFGGDWLAFLRYIGEPAHPDEQITTALPKTPLFVRTTKKAKDIAAAEGVPLETVQEILSSYWSESGTSSPVERRVEVLRKFWGAFEEVHARQTTGMRALWGLVEEGGSIAFDDVWRSPYTPGLYRDLLAPNLVQQIDELWGTTALERFADRIVSERFPHAAMAKAFGPALRVWHGCALTAWFLCEGPSSRTDMAGLAEYHDGDLDRLKELQCPIPTELFDELRLGEARLGVPQAIVRNASEVEVRPGISIRIETSSGSRRDGFEILRDIITKHRRAWTEQCLDTYLHARWETEIKYVAERYHRMVAQRGKTPTLKQFVTFGLEATNHWFGGDIGALYASIKEKAPRASTRVILMPADRVGFAWSVFCALGGEPFERQSVVANRDEASLQAAAQQRNHQLKRLAEDALRYVQLHEALGREPTLDEFGRSSFTRLAEQLSSGVEQAWSTYNQAIAKAMSTSAPPPSSYRSPGVTVSAKPKGRILGQTSIQGSGSAGTVKSSRSWLGRLFRRD